VCGLFVYLPEKGKCTQAFQASLLMCEGENWDAAVAGAMESGAGRNFF